MVRFFKQHVGVIILLIIALVFPSSLSNQARLNMRVIVTGLAIDKVDDKYEVTAQVVKTTPSAESSGSGATVNFISDSDKTMLGAVSKLSYKAGKVSAFSHTNFIIISENLAKDENINVYLNYFIRDRIIKDTALILISKGSASEEIQKTKDVELSVGLGIQKVYLFKEKESDGIMLTVLDFLKQSKSISKTSVVSSLSLKTNKETSLVAKQASESSEESGSGKTGESSSEAEEKGSNSSGGSESGGSSGSSGSDSGSQQGGEEYKYFESVSSLGVFVNGKIVGFLDTEDEVFGYLFSYGKCTRDDISVENVQVGENKSTKIGIKILSKTNKKKIRFENGKPVLDIVVKIKKAKIEEINTDNVVGDLTDSELDEISKAVQQTIKTKVCKAYEKAKALSADIFGAYNLAYRYKYNETKRFNSMEEFLADLSINVEVKVVGGLEF